MPDLWCFSSGRLSPTETVKSATFTRNPSRQVLSSDDDERQSVQSEIVIPHRTLIIPSSVPGKTIEIPLGGVSLSSSRQNLNHPRHDRSRSPKTEHAQSQMEKLTQRLKNLAKPFRSPSHTKELLDRDRLNSASPDSSGISADVTDSTSGEDTKRVSDLSSLSSVDPSSSISESNEEAKYQPSSDVRHPRQPYLSRLTNENPTSSVIQTVFDNIEKPVPRLYGENSSGREWTIPSTVEEDMQKNDSGDWNLIPTIVSPPEQPRTESSLVEEAIQSRKRIVCSKMSESLRRIENACAQINKHWRAPHLLQTNLNNLRDSATTAYEALEMFVDSTARISIDRRNPKAQEFDELLKPLLAARSHISNLRKNLDGNGWTVSVLSRDGDSSRTVDALDQFISAFQKIPTDCRRLLQWTQLLIPSSTIIFLSPLTNNKTETSTSITSTHPRTPDRLAISLGSPPFMEETKRLSSSSTSTVTSSDSSQLSSILVTKPNADKPKGRVTFADEPCDRPSVSSLNDSNSIYSKRLPNNGLSSSGFPQPPIQRLQETKIIEEDDLESVVSDRESLYQDYAYLDDAVPGRSNTIVDNTVNNGISDE
ncbi:hypothetical protein KIN20_022108, partial [Parelaphostrongylus tenuis]